MLVSIKIVSFEYTEIKVTETQSQCREEISHEPSDMLVLCSIVFGNDVENHGEHENQNGEENHEDLEISHNAHDHSDNVTETLNDPHEKEGLQKTDQDDKDDGDL